MQHLSIVFDLDGTLIDSAPDIHHLANSLLQEEGLPPITLAEARHFIGQGAAVFIRKLRQARSIADCEQARLLARFIAGYESAVHLTEPYAGVTNVLEVLQAEGACLGICTNKPHHACLAILKHLGLDKFFSVMIGGDSLPVHKPDPAPLMAAYEALGEREPVYVGDSEIDAETAKRASVPFFLFTEGYRKSPVETFAPMASFSQFEALPGLIRKFC